MAGIVVVFDFDKTIIDCDSDNWVVDNMGTTELFDKLLLTIPWNFAMDKMMKELHLQGKTIEDISGSLEMAPLYPEIMQAIKSSYALGCDLKIVSDANYFFIERILKHHGLFDYFSEIITNPGYVDEDGKLRTLPCHDFSNSPHGCILSSFPPNMCKGVVMEQIVASVSSKEMKQIIYLGDGKGNFCPSLKLREGDYVMPRKNIPLWDLICSTQSLNLKAKIHEWSKAKELETFLHHLTKTISAKDNRSPTQLISVDSKFETIPFSSQESVTKSLSVRH